MCSGLKQIGSCEKHLDEIRNCQEFTKDKTSDDQFITKNEFNSFKQDIVSKIDNLATLIKGNKQPLKIKNTKDGEHDDDNEGDEGFDEDNLKDDDTFLYDKPPCGLVQGRRMSSTVPW